MHSSSVVAGFFSCFFITFIQNKNGNFNNKIELTMIAVAKDQGDSNRKLDVTR